MKLNPIKTAVVLIVPVLLAASCAVRAVTNSGKPAPLPSARVCHVPEGAAPGSIIISFRIDGITFETWQKTVLENAAIMAGKYSITFDLAVIAKRPDNWIDPAVLNVYTMNQYAFEAVANGLTYINDINSADRGEFYNLLTRSPVAYEIQEQHIRDMRANFEQRGLYMATQIFIVPWGAGDENTVKIAEKYGYRLIAQNTVPDGSLMQNYDKNIIVQNTGVNAPGRANDGDIVNFDKKLQQLIDKNATRIQVIFNAGNFEKQEAAFNADRLLSAIKAIYRNPAVKFAKISDTLKQ